MNETNFYRLLISYSTWIFIKFLNWGYSVIQMFSVGRAFSTVPNIFGLTRNYCTTAPNVSSGERNYCNADLYGSAPTYNLSFVDRPVSCNKVKLQSVGFSLSPTDC